MLLYVIILNKRVSCLFLAFLVYHLSLPMGMQAEIADSITNQGINEGRGRNVSNGDKNCNIISSDQDRIPVADHALLTFQSNSKILGKLDAFIASKDKELSQAALKVLLSKRDKLVWLFSYN